MSVEATAENRIPEAPDRDEIVRLLSLYINGFGLDKPEAFKEVFHPRARIYFIEPDGTLWGTKDEDWLLWEPEGQWATHFDGWASSAEHAEGSHGRIIQVTQAGDLACVVLAMGSGEPMPSGDIGWWVDIHTLLRIDGTWKVMAKTAAHASHGGWAGLEPPGTPTTPDRDEIVRVARLYTEGVGATGFAVAVHPAARIYFTWEGALHEESAVEHARKLADRRMSDRVLAVTQSGDVAVVLLRIDDSWVTFRTLLRIDGAWKLMTATALQAGRADWAGLGR